MRIAVLALLLGCVAGNPVLAAPLIYSGFMTSFSKPAESDPKHPANQDFIVNGVSITRGATRGIYNAAQEDFFTDFLSPTGTRWAFPFNNSGKTLASTSWADLTFEDWQTAFGGAVAGGPPSTVDQDAVLHLVDQDIYLDIRFTAWRVGAGGFSWERSTITASADFDRDGDLDGRDFLTWQRGYGSAEALQTEGDANFDGMVTSEDLAVWQDSYGVPLAAAAAIPEPNAFLLASVTGVLVAIRRS